MWNPLGFHVIEKLPTGAIMNSEYFTTNTLARFEKISPEGRTPHAKRLIIHMDNCSIHTGGAREDYMKQNNMMRLRYARYSADLAPSDFYLFPKGKEKLERFGGSARAIYFINCRNCQMRFR
jgi:hypothetical protein